MSQNDERDTQSRQNDEHRKTIEMIQTATSAVKMRSNTR
jgi:hypothetical protein